ncbi:MAG: UDP-N-acetylmuramoyl-L-alanine--D-glutamate ligase [Pseudomonadota bacterium]
MSIAQNMENLTGKKILVLGAGKSGLAAAKLAKSWGASCAIYDDSDFIPPTDLKCYFKDPGQIDVSQFDLTIVSPGISLEHPLVKASLEKNIPVKAELEFALTGIDAKIVAVTGTNGKSTTVSLIHHMLKSAGLKSVLAGNIGLPLSAVWDEAKNADYLVLEISSFQMELCDNLKPDVAIWLNLTEDHLSRHKTMEVYSALKLKLFENLKENGVAIYNASDSLIKRAIEESHKLKARHDIKYKVFSSSIDKDVDGWFDSAKIVVSMDGTKSSIAVEDQNLVGEHNYENIAASLLTTLSLGADSSAMINAVKSFKPLKHRLQLVRKFKGVEYYNDSKGTNVDSSIKAIMSFTRPLIWIAGGYDKGLPFTPLAPYVHSKVKEMILIGDTAPRIKEELGNSISSISMAKDLGDAVKIAKERAQEGDVVLLSPACSSYDMFKDYEHRGDVFIGEVMKL